MVYELVAYNTDCRYRDDVRWREYTTSQKKAEQFAQIPKLQFTDSGHGIVFVARKHQGRRLPEVTILSKYVYKHLREIRQKILAKTV